ncbi:hypothetical protein TCON_2067 [Astathelohania contejeani]|uniref:Uncharacterized protein n=1 Tax=Astathelohania contejeani TaxID=164912 RepID=A0ABQ7HX30_9MICR|nr:hypothetical protein TCON_2067 [Thelohania contejeani]
MNFLSYLPLVVYAFGMATFIYILKTTFSVPVQLARNPIKLDKAIPKIKKMHTLLDETKILIDEEYPDLTLSSLEKLMNQIKSMNCLINDKINNDEDHINIKMRRFKFINDKNVTLLRKMSSILNCVQFISDRVDDLYYNIFIYIKKRNLSKCVILDYFEKEMHKCVKIIHANKKNLSEIKNYIFMEKVLVYKNKKFIEKIDEILFTVFDNNKHSINNIYAFNTINNISNNTKIIFKDTITIFVKLENIINIIVVLLKNLNIIKIKFCLFTEREEEDYLLLDIYLNFLTSYLEENKSKKEIIKYLMNKF